MASEIRANKQTNRVGLGTVTYTDTGIIVSGIVTANSFKGDGSSLTGIDATALKDTGGNVKIQANASGAVHSGISTFNEIKLSDTNKVVFGTDSDLEIFHSSGANYIKTTSAQNLVFGSNVTNRIILQSDGHLRPVVDSTYDLGLAGTRFRNIYADTYYGDGANLTNLPAGAPVGGASTNTVFFENDKAVAVNYQVTLNKNAMSAGPISINAGIAVTVPSGCSWTIV
tara:strand:- start:608 stop:1288 length:681 start_codon:yes stop_codon:yes gene_type:complete